MYHGFLSHSSANGLLDCFHVLAILNSAAWTLRYTCLFQFWFPWCVYPAVGLLGHMTVLFPDSGRWVIEDPAVIYVGELPYDPAIPLLGIHTEETRIERDTCTPIFIAALFTIASIWKQPRCPSADEWIRKLWYRYTMEYYSAIKENAFESVLMRWMKLEPIMQSEVSQEEKHQYSILTHIYGI